MRVAAEEYHLDANKLTAVGFSNGATFAASLLLRHPRFLPAAILLRPMVPYEPEGSIDLLGVAVFIATGREDPKVKKGATEQLAQLLRDAGAEVELSWSPGGHSLDQDEVLRGRAWPGKHRPDGD